MIIGHFKGAELPNLKNFREFRGYAEDLKEKVFYYKYH
jgi:predicted sulfurtransferase